MCFRDCRLERCYGHDVMLTNFNFQQGIELPLFTFTNIGTGCFGNIELVDNANTRTKAVINGGYNIGQHIGLLGAGGEAYAGLANAVVSCDASTGTTSSIDLTSVLNGYPSPTSKVLTVEWQLSDLTLNSKLAVNLHLTVTNTLGEEVFSQKLSANTVAQKTALDVSSYAEGLYHFRLVSDHGISKSTSFVVIH